MELFEYEAEETVQREEAARRLRELADQLERHNAVRISLDGLPVTVKVPKEVTYELEVEAEDDGVEIEVSISW